MGENWLILDGLMILGQYGVVLVDTWWYWVSKTWYCLVSSGTGSVYIEKSGDLVGCHRSLIERQTDNRI